MGNISPEVFNNASIEMSKRYPDEAFPALTLLKWEKELDVNIPTITREALENWGNKPVEFDHKIFNSKYRDYYNYREKKSDILLVQVKNHIKYGTKDVYYGYSITPIESLIKSQAASNSLQTRESLSQVIPLSDTDGANLAIDIFQSFSTEKQRNILEAIATKLGYRLASDANISLVRRVFSLHYGNKQLIPLFRESKGEIYLREPVAEALKKVNEQLSTLGYSIGLESGHRSGKEQRVIKENHARTYGEKEANALYADAGKSAHNTGGALDIVLFDASGKKLNLAIGNNAAKTKTSTYGEEAIRDGIPLSEKDMTAIKLRRMLHHAMLHVGFTPHHLEYWHFDAPGDRFYGYIKSKSIPGYNKPAFYGNVER